MSILEADHARIVAEATAEARAAERRHWEARFRNAEQAHAAALAAANGYRCDCVGEHDGGCNQDYYAWQQIGREAAAPRTLTADETCPTCGRSGHAESDTDA